MKPEIMIVFGIFLTFALLEALFTSLHKKPNQTRADVIVESVSTIATLGLIQPFIVLMSATLLGWSIPLYQGSLADLGFLAGFALFLIFDDLAVYCWHRLAHSVPVLYNMHRPHHNGEYMSVRVTFRNNLFYYLFSPPIWLSGVLIYLGLGHVYAVYLVMKMAVILSSHSDVRWDAPLYRIAWLSPLMWVVERIIVTPAAHHAHHGKHLADGATHYKGNFGNMLIVWDLLFGTAFISRQVPKRYGVEDLPETTAAEQLIWPLAHAPAAARVSKEVNGNA